MLSFKKEACSESMRRSALEIKDEGEDFEPEAAHSPSELAQEIKELQSSITRAIEKRERLPQPMFWSLFNSRIKDMRKRRELLRTLNSLLGG